MRGRWARLAAAMVCVALLSAATVPNASGAVARRPTVPSDHFCTAFGDYFQIVFQLQFVTAFASLGESKSKPTSPKSTAKEVRNLFLLVLSPKLERLTRQMAAEPKTQLRTHFSQQAKSFAAGVDLLRSVGFTNKQLRVLAKSSLDTSDAALKRVVGKVKATDKQMNAAAKEFGKQGVTLDLGTVGAKDQRALARVGSACGTFPSAVDCATLVTTAEAAAILGGAATKADTSSCGYDGPEPAVGTKPQLGFDVYTSARAFATVTKGRPSNVADIGDEAATLEGFNTFSLDSSCGTSLAVRKGEHVVVVALCLADTNRTVTSVRLGTLIGIARQILDRL